MLAAATLLPPPHPPPPPLAAALPSTSAAQTRMCAAAAATTAAAAAGLDRPWYDRPPPPTKRPEQQPEAEALTDKEVDDLVVKISELLAGRSPRRCDLDAARESTLRKLLRRGHKAKHWKDAVVTCPELLDHSAGGALAMADVLVEAGLTHRAALRCLAVQPDVIAAMTADEFAQKIPLLKSFGRKFDLDWERLLTCEPELLLTDGDGWQVRVNKLREYFTDQDAIVDLLGNDPSVLTEDWEILNKKLLFVFRVMHVAPSELAKTAALSYDLRHIQERYCFASRCGKYTHPDPKGKAALITASPDIALVVETDVQDFVNTVVGSGLTVEEYNVFLSLMAEELGEFEAGDDDDDDDEEDEQFKKNWMKSDKVKKVTHTNKWK